jgi:2-isopropylmalate synthase
MPDRVAIFDTTLRDGEQSPGASLNVKEKVEIAKQLERLGVDIIEAGFPVSSPGEIRAFHSIAAEVTKPTLCGLARVVQRDIDAAAEALAPARRSRIHVFIGTSPVHIEAKLKKTEAEVIEMAVRGIEYARERCDEVEFSAEDATRTPLPYLKEVCIAAIGAGATTINLPDTVGYTWPAEYAEMIRYLLAEVPGMDQIVISVHCHNDLGMAVANSLSAVTAGARQVECTVNGIGERAGNCALEEVVMAMRTRPDIFDAKETGVQPAEIVRASRMVSNLTGIIVQPNKAVVGSNAFAHESGIHQDGVLKERTTYEIMDPAEVGAGGTKLVLGPRSGRHALKHRLAELGYDVPDERMAQVYQRFLEVAEAKKQVYDEDLAALMEEHATAPEGGFELIRMQTVAGSSSMPTATIAIRTPSGEEVMESAAGVGPVEAACLAIDRITGIRCKLVDYSLRAVREDRSAVGQARIKVEDEGLHAVGVGASPDIVEASARAYLAAVNRIIAQKATGNGKGADEG